MAHLDNADNPTVADATWLSTRRCSSGEGPPAYNFFALHLLHKRYRHLTDEFPEPFSHTTQHQVHALFCDMPVE